MHLIAIFSSYSQQAQWGSSLQSLGFSSLRSSPVLSFFFLHGITWNPFLPWPNENFSHKGLIVTIHPILISTHMGSFPPFDQRIFQSQWAHCTNSPDPYLNFLRRPSGIGPHLSFFGSLRHSYIGPSPPTIFLLVGVLSPSGRPISGQQFIALTSLGPPPRSTLVRQFLSVVDFLTRLPSFPSSSLARPSFLLTVLPPYLNSHFYNLSLIHI